MKTYGMDNGTDLQALDMAVAVLSQIEGVEAVALHQHRDVAELLYSAARRALYYSTRSRRWGINLVALEDVEAGLRFEAGILARMEAAVA